MNIHASNHLIRSVIGAVAALVLLSATSVLADSDAFNRPKLGNNWIVTSGSLSIANNGMVGDSLSLGYLTAMRNDTAASAVVFLNGTDLQYGAVAVGNIAGDNNAFVKIQQQDGTGMFEYAGFYTSNNVGGYFFTLSEPVPSPAILMCPSPILPLRR